MESIADRIKSIRDTMGGGFRRPDASKLDKMIAALRESSSAMEYLTNVRGLAEETIVHFKLGFDASTNAIAIPLFKNDELINIKYRFLDPGDGTRYTSEAGAETWVFNEGGLGVARSKGAVLIVEGEFDCMKAWQAGLKNVISPSSGKDSYGVWLELLEGIPKVYIGYDNDEGGRSAALKLAERVGTEKCIDVKYPDAKDANEYLLKHTPEEFRQVIKESKPMIRQQFKTVGDVLGVLRNGLGHFMDTKFIPGVKFQRCSGAMPFK
jgi:DNA primase